MCLGKLSSTFGSIPFGQMDQILMWAVGIISVSVPNSHEKKSMVGGLFDVKFLIARLCFLA
jgi:hypothetical protein